MLDSLITSRTRIKMLLKFFTNPQATAYLRGLAEEFGESTNSIRHELNNLSRAGYILSAEAGRTIQYRVNIDHPLYHEVRNLVHKYLGIDKIVTNVVQRLGDVKAAFIVGDYARGRDSGVIELVIVGTVDQQYLNRLLKKASDLIARRVKASVVGVDAFNGAAEHYASALLIWNSPEAHQTKMLNQKIQGKG